MFGELEEQDGGSVATADVYEQLAPSRESPDRVYSPHKVTSHEVPGGARARHRVTLPRQNNFFENYPHKWTWESWGKRVEQEWLMMARGLEAVIWATIGGLLGLAIFAIPGAFADGYPYVVWQPLGAALGSAFGAITVWRRWKRIFQSHHDLTR